MEKWERELAKRLKKKYPHLKRHSDEKVVSRSYRLLREIKKTSEEE